MKDAINVYVSKFCPETGTVTLPDAFKEVISSDAKLELVTSVEA